ncbi:MAG: peptide chain release factor N(5)-glutamine methyltransferase [Gallionellaceae bacterium]|nr:peptide chain release factor N(5)-glutamine methyltransferase [Gallionellaceae bacterium]
MLPLPQPLPRGGRGGRLADLLRSATERLSLTLPPREARLEAQILFAHGLGVNRAWLIGHDRDRLTPEQIAAVAALLKRRLAGEPVAYLLGEREFYGRPFRVTPDVLIPRPDTELLVELALERLPPNEALKVLDIGVGSGAVAVSLALERPRCRVTGVDLSAGALRVAEANAEALRAGVEFLISDGYEALGGRRFHLIASNPPYIAAADPHLKQGDLRFEPPLALASGGDGLDLIRRLVSEAPAHLEPGGWLLLEHGWDQAAAVRALLREAGFSAVFSATDLGGHERVTGGDFSL